MVRAGPPCESSRCPEGYRRCAPFSAFFIPYYGLAVIALIVHVTCAFHYLGRLRMVQPVRDRLGYLGIACGVVLAVVIVAAYSAVFYPIEIPQEYQRTFQ